MHLVISNHLLLYAPCVISVNCGRGCQVAAYCFDPQSLCRPYCSFIFTKSAHFERHPSSVHCPPLHAQGLCYSAHRQCLVQAECWKQWLIRKEVGWSWEPAPQHSSRDSCLATFYRWRSRRQMFCTIGWHSVTHCLGGYCDLCPREKTIP